MRCFVNLYVTTRIFGNLVHFLLKKSLFKKEALVMFPHSVVPYIILLILSLLYSN
jgi:hypothetical protein